MEKKTNRILMGFMYLFFNQFGVPAFLEGNSKEGIKHILVSCLTFGIGALVYEIMGLIEAIRIFKMTDEEYLAK